MKINFFRFILMLFLFLIILNISLALCPAGYNEVELNRSFITTMSSSHYSGCSNANINWATQSCPSGGSNNTCNNHDLKACRDTCCAIDQDSTHGHGSWEYESQNNAYVQFNFSSRIISKVTFSSYLSNNVRVIFGSQPAISIGNVSNGSVNNANPLSPITSVTIRRDATNNWWNIRNVRFYTCQAQTINGQCGTIINSCTSGTFNDTPDDSNFYRWDCIGQNGGQNATCAINKPVNGECSLELNQCIKGTFEDIEDNDSNYLWNCNGVYGGTLAQCSLNKPINGECGSAAKNYSYNSTNFEGTFCLNGELAGATPSFPNNGESVNWTCNGLYGGNNSAQCTAHKEEALNCQGPDGDIIFHGETKTYYEKNIVEKDKTCISEDRTCINGVLSGTYENQICNVKIDCLNCNTLNNLVKIDLNSVNFIDQNTIIKFNVVCDNYINNFNDFKIYFSKVKQNDFVIDSYSDKEYINCNNNLENIEINFSSINEGVYFFEFYSNINNDQCNLDNCLKSIIFSSNDFSKIAGEINNNINISDNNFLVLIILISFILFFVKTR